MKTQFAATIKMQKFLVAAALVGGANAAGHCETAGFCGTAVGGCTTETDGNGQFRATTGCDKASCEGASTPGVWTPAASAVPAACDACPAIGECLAELHQVMDCAKDAKNGLKTEANYAAMTCANKIDWISEYAKTSDGLPGAKAADAVVWPAAGGRRRRLAGHAGHCKTEAGIFAKDNFETTCATWTHGGVTSIVPKLKAATVVTSIDVTGKTCDVAAMVAAECWKFVDCHAGDRRRMGSHENHENGFCPAEKATGDKTKTGSTTDGSADGSATSAAATLGAFAAVVAMFL